MARPPRSALPPSAPGSASQVTTSRVPVPVRLGHVLSGRSAALASFGTLARIASPGERSELLAVALVIAYLAFSLPAIAAGYSSNSFGLHATTVVYSLGIVALGLVALAAQGMNRSRAGL